LRAVRDYFGVDAEVDWALVEQLLARAATLPARIRLLRQLLGLYPRSGEVNVLYPNSFNLRLRLLAALEEGNRLPEARRLAHELRSDPLADAEVRTTVGEMYLRLDEVDEARRVFSEIVEFAPYDAAARRRLGDLYRAHGWFDDAYRQYQTLAAIRPDDPSVSLLLAQAAAGAGRVDEAIRLEQALAETAEPGAASGLARVAILWSSVRFAKLRAAAREGNDAERVRSLVARMRRTGILREAGALRISLTWSHPDAGLSLWVAQPGMGPTRPTDLASEFGLEAFDLEELEAGQYRIEVRRQSQDMRTPVEAELTILWNEGQPDEQIQARRLTFEGDRRALAWTLDGRAVAEAAAPVEGVPIRREVRR
jgi:Ca-activated chloride channel family protein